MFQFFKLGSELNFTELVTTFNYHGDDEIAYQIVLRSYKDNQYPLIYCIPASKKEINAHFKASVKLYKYLFLPFLYII